MNAFRIKPEHIKLLHNANVTWDDGEFGAPAIDCKRPYGNSSVYRDIAEILDIQPDEDGEFSFAQENDMFVLHKETQTALKIFLQTGKMKAGVYERSLASGEWDLIDET